MSAPSAIAAVTLTVNSMLDTHLKGEFPGLGITMLTPSSAGNTDSPTNHLNLYLYSTSVNTAFSNSTMHSQTKSGETGIPPLALVLKYLITVYNSTDDDTNGHQLLGAAMLTLHDHPILSRSDIEDALPEAGLHNQIERVRITHDVMSIDDMSKLWTSFQSEYRLSIGYEVSVVLIESTRPATTPLPVLTRGIAVQPNLIPPYPTIDGIEYPIHQSSALLGDALTINGHHLDGEILLVRFTHPRLQNPIDVPVVVPDDVTDKQVKVQIPDDPGNWPVGFYTAEIIITKAGNTRTTNNSPFTLSPIIDTINPPNPISRDQSDNVTLTLTCIPEVLPDQRAALLLGDREVLANEHENKTASLDFLITEAAVGEQYLRLRVDGVDSHLIKHDETPPVFDANMLVTIQ